METSAEVPQSLSSFHVEHGAAPELDCSDWKPSSEQHIPDSLCLSCLSTSTSSCEDLLHVKNRPGLDAPLHVSKSHDCSASCVRWWKISFGVFRCWGRKRPLSPVHLSKEFPGVIAPACAVAVLLSVSLMVYLLMPLFSALCKSMLLK